MGETGISDYMYGILIVVLFIVGGVSMLGIMKSENGSFDSVDQTGEFNRTFNKLDEVTDTVDSIETNIQDADAGGNFGAFGVLNSLISSAWNTLKLMFNSLSFMDEFFAGTSSFFGIPNWITGILGMFITILIGFTIYSAIFQRKT